MAKISGIIITYNEEAIIETALKSLQRVCDEIIVFDSFSTDKTAEIVKQYGCIVYSCEFDNHRNQKNRAIEKCRNEWILVIDADEYFDDELINNIHNLVEQNEIDCFGFARKNSIDNGELLCFPDFQTRLFKNYVRYSGHPFHHHNIYYRNQKNSTEYGNIIHKKTKERATDQCNMYSTMTPQDFKGSGIDYSNITNWETINVYRDYILKNINISERVKYYLGDAFSENTSEKIIVNIPEECKTFINSRLFFYRGPFVENFDIQRDGYKDGFYWGKNAGFPLDIPCLTIGGDMQYNEGFPSIQKVRQLKKIACVKEPIENDMYHNAILIKADCLRHWEHVDHVKKTDIKWEQKIPSCIWRGASTGFNLYQYIRINFVKMYHDMYDIGFSVLCQGINDETLVSKEMTIEEMLNYKYVISIEGNDKDSGLNWKLASNSIVIMRRPSIESWLMEGRLQEYVHYVPINDDFTGLPEALEWCKNNDDKCKEIVRNANVFMHQFEDYKTEKLIHDKILEYYQSIYTLNIRIAMQHFYQNIQGWFDFQEVYSSQIKIAKDNFHFVEVGAWLGASTAFMAVEIINSGKKIKFDVVDTWKGSINELDAAHKLATETDIFEIFKNNLLPVINSINPIRLDSIEASELYKDESLDFVFVDASQLYQFVSADIKAWYPKVKKNGYIGGHDYRCGWPGVDTAVDELFKDVKHVGNSWIIEKL